MATPTTRLKLKKQALSENLNTWGLSNGINGVIDQVDVLAGYLEVDLGTSTSYTFGTTNYSVAGNEHAYRAVKFTGTPASGVTVNIPAVDDFKFIENATGQTITFSNGSTTATLANTFTGYLRTNGSSSITVLVLPDGVNIQTVANDINNVNLVAGQIAPTNNIAALGIISSDITTVANPTYKALVEVVGEATYKALVEVVGETNYKALVEVVGESVYKSLVETVGNATYKALVETVGETTYKALVETVGESVYKSVVETVGEAVYKAKVETVADATYKSQIEALNDVTYKAQLQDIATSPYKPLVETVGNATYKALVEVVGESTYKALVETVGNSTYKALVEVVGESVYKGKVEIVANNEPAVSNVSNKMDDVNNFNDLYQIASSDPSTDGGGNALSGGDLYYSTSGNKLRVYNQSSGNWEDVAVTAGSFLQVSNNLSDIANAATARTNLGGVITEISQDTTPQLGGDLDMQSHSISSGVLGIKNTGAQSELRLYCESGNAHFTSLKSAPHAQYSGNLTFVLPATVGAAGQVLTDAAGNGVLAWSTPASGGGGVATQMKFE